MTLLAEEQNKLSDWRPLHEVFSGVDVDWQIGVTTWSTPEVRRCSEEQAAFSPEVNH